MVRILMGMAGWSANHPKGAAVLILLITLGFLSRIPSLAVNDESLDRLATGHSARILQARIGAEFSARDGVILAVESPDGVFNFESLVRYMALSGFLGSLPGIVSEDVVSLATTDNVIAQDDRLLIRPPLQNWIADDASAHAVFDELRSNPLFIGRLVSEDGTVAAMFAPIADNSTRREIYQAVTRQLAVMAPALNGDRILVSGKVMTEGALGDAMRSDLRRLGSVIVVVLLVLLTVYFRCLSLAILPVITAVVSVIWTLGLLAALGIPVYLPIMLVPVILLVIGITDEVHLIDVYRCYLLDKDRKSALLDALQKIARRLTLTSLTATAGFMALGASLAPQLKYFGFFTAFGIGVAYLLIFTLTPAYLMMLRQLKRWDRAESHSRLAGGAGLERIGHPSHFWRLH